jgi:hypothetical protein
VSAHEDGGRVPAEGGRTDDLLASALRFVDTIVTAVRRQIAVYADRRRLALRRSLIRAAVGAALAAGAIVWLCAAALAILRGLCGGLAALFGDRAWAGDLAGGALALALVVAALFWAARLSARAELRRLEAKYDRLREHPGANGRGVPRPGGRPGTSADADRDAPVR